MDLQVVTTKNEIHFLLDQDTAHQTGKLITANFIMMIVKKVFPGPEAKTQAPKYEYPEMVFTNQKAYRVNQVESQRDANELEVQLYSLLQAKQKLTKEIRQSLRDQYLVVETADQDDDEIEQTIE